MPGAGNVHSPKVYSKMKNRKVVNMNYNTSRGTILAGNLLTQLMCIVRASSDILMGTLIGFWLEVFVDIRGWSSKNNP